MTQPAITRAGEGTTLFVLGDRVSTIGQAGDFLLAEVEVAPGTGTPLHTHPGPEILRVTEGELELSLQGGLTILGPGDTASIPGGAPHGYRNAGERPVRMLAVLDTELHAFFRAVGSPTPPSGPPSPEILARVAAAAQTHGLKLLAPV